MPLSFTLSLGPISAEGGLVLEVSLPDSTELIDQTIYAVAAFHNGIGWEFSDTLKVVVVERETQLAGNALGAFPYFEYVRAFNETLPLSVAVDPLHHPQVVGETAGVYVVVAKDAAQWDADPGLVDVSGGGIETVVFGATLGGNIFTVDGGTLSTDRPAGCCRPISCRSSG